MKLKEITLFLLVTAILTTSSGCTKKEPILVYKMLNEEELPQAFRTSNDPYKRKSNVVITRKGLEKLRISGSGQFSEKSFGVVLKTLNQPEPIYVIDLREESHGFLNGIAVSWYGERNRDNKGLTIAEIEAKENSLLADALAKKTVVLHKILTKDLLTGSVIDPKTYPLVVESAKNEKTVIKEYNSHYIRLPITDHEPPTEFIVNEFVKVVKALPDNRWIHVHCAGGVGRTTTVMAMLDMMENAKELTFDEIITRQYLLGGRNLLNHPHTKLWKREQSIERENFLRDFYNYSRYNKDNFATPWKNSIHEIDK